MRLQSGIVFPRRNAEIDVFNLLSEHLLLGASAGKQSVDTEVSCAPRAARRLAAGAGHGASLSPGRSPYLAELVGCSSLGETAVPVLLAGRVSTQQPLLHLHLTACFFFLLAESLWRPRAAQQGRFSLDPYNPAFTREPT